MKAGFFKKVIYTLALLSALFLLWFGNAFLGNPLSRLLASRTAHTHLAAAYSESDFQIERINYSFKDGNYHAFVTSPSSMDTYFSLSIDMLGRLRMDTYDSVVSGFNTARRLDDGYRALTDTVFDAPSFPYVSQIAFGELVIYPEEHLSVAGLDAPSYTLLQEDLVLDKVYDIAALGAQAGHLVIYIDSETVSVEQAAAMMIQIRQQFDQANVPFTAMDFTLQHPLPKEGGGRSDETVSVSHFLREEIYPEGMTDRVAQADRELKAYYAELDAAGKEKPVD